MDYNPMKTIDISPTKTIVIGLTNQLRLSYITMGHHLVCVCLRCCFFVVPGGAEKHLRPKRRFGDWTKNSLGNSLPCFHNEVMPIVNKTTGWWCQPLWKIWVRHLGLLFNSQYMGKMFPPTRNSKNIPRLYHKWLVYTIKNWFYI